MPTDRNLIRGQVSTYAEVLLQGARSENAVFDVATQLVEATEAIRSSSQLRATLKDTAYPLEVRTGLIKEIFKESSPALVAVLNVMVERGEVNLLTRVNRAYAELAEAELGAVIVDVTSAIELDDHLRDVIKNKLSRDFGTDILLREHVDPSILGGIIMSARGNRIDASMASQLERARVALSTQLSGGDE